MPRKQATTKNQSIVIRYTAGEAKLATTAAARRAEELLELIARRTSRIREDFYDIGSALREVMDKKLYQALGYDSFEDLLAKRALLGKTQAYKLLAVVRHLPRKEALTLGQEKAYALAALARATPRLDSVGMLLEKGVTLRSGAKDVRNLSKREIEELTKEVRKPRKLSKEAKAASQRVKHAQAVLRKRKIGATVEAKRQGNAWWAMIRVPLASLESLVGDG